MNLIKEIEKLIEPLLEQEGFELVEIQFANRPHQGMTLTIYIDKKDIEPEKSSRSVSLNDCQNLSEKIGFLLDKEDIIPHAYTLEVSSPGIYRRLKKEKDFIKFTGKRVRIKLYQAVENQQKNFLGYIEKCENNILTLKTIDNKLLKLNLEQIAYANLEPEIKL